MKDAFIREKSFLDTENRFLIHGKYAEHKLAAEDNPLGVVLVT